MDIEENESSIMINFLNNLYDLTLLEQTKKISFLIFCQVRIGGALLKKTEKKKSKILGKIIHTCFLPYFFLEPHKEPVHQKSEMPNQATE